MVHWRTGTKIKWYQETEGAGKFWELLAIVKVVSTLSYHLVSGSIPGHNVCHILAEYVLSSPYIQRLFSGFSGFPPKHPLGSPHTSGVSGLIHGICNVSGKVEFVSLFVLKGIQ